MHGHRENRPILIKHAPYIAFAASIFWQPANVNLLATAAAAAVSIYKITAAVSIYISATISLCIPTAAVMLSTYIAASNAAVSVYSSASTATLAVSIYRSAVIVAFPLYWGTVALRTVTAIMSGTSITAIASVGELIIISVAAGAAAASAAASTLAAVAFFVTSESALQSFAIVQ